MAKKPRTAKQLAADKKRSKAMKGKKPAFLKNKNKKAKSKKSSKKRTYTKKSKKSSKRRGGNKGMKSIGITVGVVGSIISAATYYGKHREGGMDIGESLSSVLLGYEPGGENKFSNVSVRLARTYGPVVGGVAIHKAAGKLGVNQQLPKGINL